VFVTGIIIIIIIIIIHKFLYRHNVVTSEAVAEQHDVSLLRLPP